MTTTAEPRTPLACPPLFGTPRSPDRPTLGPRIAEVGVRLGKPPLPHQAHMFDVLGEIDPETGLLAYSEVVVIGPRQVTGKTESILPVMTYRCTAFDRALAQWSRREFGKTALEVPDPGAQRVLYTAQTADKAREKWRDIHLERLKTSSYRRDFHARLQRNSEAFIWRNGSMWSPSSTTGKTSGTGDTVDLGVIDEAWSQKDDSTELGLRPAKMTRWWSQLLVASMIPGLSRAPVGSWPYLAKKLQVGRARVEADVRYGTAFFYWAAAPGSDPGDPQTWWSCMPALGHTVREQTVREDFEAMDLVDFSAEYLGWPPLASAPRWTLIGQDTWGRLRDPHSHIEGRPALALEVDEDRGSAVIGVAGRRFDGHWHGAVAEPGYEVAPGVTGLGWVLPRTVDLYRELKAWTVVIDPARPASSFIVPLRNAGVDVTTPNQREVAGACGRFFDATGEEQREDDDGVRLFHLGQPDLDRSLAGARKLDVGQGAFVFVKKGSAAAIKPLYAVVLAMHGHDVKGGQVIPDPDIFI
jgi:hypothetical protein